MPHIIATPANRMPQAIDDVIVCPVGLDYWYLVDHPQGPFKNVVAFRRANIDFLSSFPVTSDRDGQALDPPVHGVVINFANGVQCFGAVGFASQEDVDQWIYQHAAEWLG